MLLLYTRLPRRERPCRRSCRPGHDGSPVHDRPLRRVFGVRLWWVAWRLMHCYSTDSKPDDRDATGRCVDTPRCGLFATIAYHRVDAIWSLDVPP